MGAKSRFDGSHGAPLPNETWGPGAEPEPRKSELHFTHVLVHKPPFMLVHGVGQDARSVESLLSIDSPTDTKACHREVASAYAEPEPRKSELHFTHVLVRKPPSVESLLSIDSPTDMKACHREVASAYASKYGLHPRAPIEGKKAAGNKKKTHRRNQSSLSSLSVGKEFSRRTKDTSKLRRIIGSVKDFHHVLKDFNHLAIISNNKHSGFQGWSGKPRNSALE